MGKGGDDCSVGIGMNAALLGLEADEALAFDDELVEAAGGWNVFAEEQGKTATESLEKARELETKIKLSAQKAVEKLKEMHAKGYSAKRINTFFDKQIALQSAEIHGYLNENDIPPYDPELDVGEGILQTVPEKILFVSAAKRLYETTNNPDLKFQEKFMNSPEFIRNLRRILAKGTANEAIDKAIAGKEMEIAYRQAALMTIGISDSTRNNGRWIDEDGNEYVVEVMREFSGTALMDLIIAAKPVSGDSEKVYTMQWKSYQTTAPIGSTPKPFKERDSRSIKIAELTSLTPAKKRSLEALADEVQMRFLATNTFTDTSAHNQKGDHGFTEMITHTTRLSQPEIHRAIVTTPNLASSFEPVRKSDGSYGPLEAKIEGTLDSGEPFIAKVKSQMYAKLDSKGRPIKRNGNYVIAKTDAERGAKGERAKETDSNSGKISIDISHSGWHRLHTIALRNRMYAEGMARRAEDSPDIQEKLRKYGIL